MNNITRISAVLLIDMRDPPTQLTSTGYRISCEESQDKRLVFNIGKGIRRLSIVKCKCLPVVTGDQANRAWLEQVSVLDRVGEIPRAKTFV